MMKNIIVLLISITWISLIISCNDTRDDFKTDLKGSIQFTVNNKELYNVLDSFSKLNLKYTHCIETVGYLKIIESEINSEMKILIESFEINSPNLKNLTFNEELKINNYRFFYNQNIDNYFGKNGYSKNIEQVLKTEIVKNSKKRGCGSEFTWLVHFSKKSLDTISYGAMSQFEIPCTNCNEWGDLSKVFVKTKDSLKRIKL